MVTVRKRRRRRSAKRSNPRKKATIRRKSAAKRTRKAARKNPSLAKRARKRAGTSRHRVTLYRTSSGWHRPKRSRLMPKPTRVNPRKRRRTRRNPPRTLRGIFNQRFFMTSVKTGIGLTSGFLTLPLVYKILPENAKVNDKGEPAAWLNWIGILNVVTGGLLQLVKNKDVRDVGLIIAGTGAYDMIARNTQESLGLPVIPLSNIFVTKLLPDEKMEASYYSPRRAGYGASYQVTHRPVSPVARAGVGASYYAPSSETEGLGTDYDALSQMQ